MRRTSAPGDPTWVSAESHAEVVSAGDVPEMPEGYAFVRKIDEGGMGVVYEVRDETLNVHRALKVMEGRRRTESELWQFRREVDITATLDHPSVVPVFGTGMLPDGRMWYTMRLVDGVTLSRALFVYHSGHSKWTLRQLVARLEMVARTVDWAHRNGVVHRDLKPKNLMLDRFDSVQVLDWGIAVLRSDFVPEASRKAGHGNQSRPIGTPQYMAPEQARGLPPDEQCDVYSLGVILFEILLGRVPLDGDPHTILRRLRSGAEVDVAPRLSGTPEGLAAICTHALKWEPSQRYKSCAVFADDLRAWFDGEQKQVEAIQLAAKARPLLEEARRLRNESRALRQGAEAQLDGVLPGAPEADKHDAWALQDRAESLLVEADVLDASAEQNLRAALIAWDRHDPAHQALADLYRRAAEEAEAAHDGRGAARARVLLSHHDRGRHAAWLRGDSWLRLDTAPGQAATRVYTWRAMNRYLRPELIADLGVAPIANALLPAGSHLLEFALEGRATVRMPIVLLAGERWERRAPWESADRPVVLRLRSEIGPDDCLVPAGFFQAGGDADALDGLPRIDLWVEGFVMRRYPVTNLEYAAYLDDLRRTGNSEEATRRTPRMAGQSALAHAFVWDGTQHVLGSTTEGPLLPNEPVVFVDWYDASAYAEWYAARTGEAWRLPHELEWEKAARGVDGRLYPWGDHFEPTWTNVPGATGVAPRRAVVTDWPKDQSPYGVRGLTGNVRDWCANAYRKGHTWRNSHRVDVHEHVDQRFRLMRGGSWIHAGTFCRSAARVVGLPDQRMSHGGFRLVRTLDL